MKVEQSGVSTGRKAYSRRSLDGAAGDESAVGRGGSEEGVASVGWDVEGRVLADVCAGN